MGNFEKAVVLLILLVCAIVLGISLRPAESLDELAGSPVEAATQLGRPLEVASSREERAPAAADEARPTSAIRMISKESPAPASARTSRVDRAPDPLLSSLVDASGDRDVVLVSTEDLRETVSPDYLLYTCRAGDEWVALAERFYGDAGLAVLLRGANEGLETMAGQRILVPVYDLVAEGADREPAEPRRVPEFRLYTVRDGDSLSSISTEFFGTGARWMAIYDANRDVLEDPDRLTVGASIRIPN